MLAEIRAAQELVAPVAGGAAPLRAFLRQGPAIPLPAMIAANLERPVHPWLERMVGELKGEDQDVVPPVTRLGELSFVAFDQTGVGRIEPGLADGAHRFDRFS